MSAGASPGDPAASSASDATVPAERTPTAVYERELDASVERIWENVLDWEHLPYLHAQAFTSVRMTSIDRDHWHGEVGLPGLSGATAEIDVRLDRANLRYTTSTVAGAGAGTEIVTQMFPRSERNTGIRVDFHMPWAPAGTEAAVGEFYTRLYVQLWDQDEAMMRERQRVLDAAAAGGRAARGVSQEPSPGPTQGLSHEPSRESLQSPSQASVSLGRVRELAARLPLEVELGGRRFRVVGIEGRLFAHDTQCPHLGGPLAEHDLEGCEAVCPWHGYRFDVRTGLSSDGRSLRLARSAVVEIDACSGDVRLRLP